MAYNLQVEESVDAKSFKIRNFGDTITNANRIVITTPTVTLIYDLTGKDINSEITVYASDFTDPNIGDYFEDGIYTFEIQDPSNNIITSTTEGFIAIVAIEVFKDALSYRIGTDNYEKYILLEKTRLLDNLSYSAELGLVNAFYENLNMLKKLV